MRNSKFAYRWSAFGPPKRTEFNWAQRAKLLRNARSSTHRALDISNTTAHGDERVASCFKIGFAGLVQRSLNRIPIITDLPADGTKRCLIQSK